MLLAETADFVDGRRPGGWFEGAFIVRLIDLGEDSGGDRVGGRLGLRQCVENDRWLLHSFRFGQLLCHRLLGLRLWRRLHLGLLLRNRLFRLFLCRRLFRLHLCRQLLRLLLARFGLGFGWRLAEGRRRWGDRFRLRKLGRRRREVDLGGVLGRFFVPNFVVRLGEGRFLHVLKGGLNRFLLVLGGWSREEGKVELLRCGLP